MIRLAVAGANGRMGRIVIESARNDPRFTLAAALVRPGSIKEPVQQLVSLSHLPVADALNVPCDVLIDFTLTDGTRQWLQRCVELGTPLVIGATGHDEAALSAVRAAAQIIPIVKSTNFSMGIALLQQLVAMAARQLGEDYDIEVVETHHRHKRDVPSGTALTLVDEMLRAMNQPPLPHWGRGQGEGEAPMPHGAPRAEAEVVYGRGSGERKKGQIGVHSIRLGEIVGQHEVHFGGAGETITLRHEAHSRETFARGSLTAAAWLIGRPPGLYSMQDVLFSEPPSHPSSPR